MKLQLIRLLIVFIFIFGLVLMLSYGWLHERQLSEVKPASLPTLKDITFQQRPVHVPFGNNILDALTLPARAGIISV
jgi:hypothetical protein